MTEEQIIQLARDIFGMGGDYPLLTVEAVLEFAAKVIEGSKS